MGAAMESCPAFGCCTLIGPRCVTSSASWTTQSKTGLRMCSLSSRAEAWHTIADDLPGLQAQVSLSELTGDKTWEPQIKFDLCLCSLGASELAQFNDLVMATAPHMHSGGKIIGCYLNFGLRPLSKHEIVMLQNVSDLPWPTKVHYAGSRKS